MKEIKQYRILKFGMIGIVVGALLFNFLQKKNRLQHIASHTKQTVKEVKIAEPIHLNSGNFKKTLQNNAFVLVMFHATWCGACKRMHPKIKELTAKLERTPWVVGALDIDQSKNIATEYNIDLYPTFIIYKKGQVATVLRGSQTKEKLLNELQEVEKNTAGML